VCLEISHRLRSSSPRPIIRKRIPDYSYRTAARFVEFSCPAVAHANVFALHRLTFAPFTIGRLTHADRLAAAAIFLADASSSFRFAVRSRPSFGSCKACAIEMQAS
jgi:hypothetical protein